jgi:penicillin amidase
MRIAVRVANTLAALVVTAGVLTLCAVGDIPHLPPLGPAFNPSTGLWRLVAGASLPVSTTLSNAPVHTGATVAISATGIPTITASNDYDAMVAEGYVTASNRLLEMDLQRRLAEGTLSAVLGSASLKSDELQLSLGLDATAKAEWASLAAHPYARSLVLGYCAGVNMAIRHLEATHTLPTAMTLLHYTPAPWTPVDTFLTQGDLTEELDYTTTPADLALLQHHLGAARTAAWFPTFAATPQAPYDRGPYRHDPLVPIVNHAPNTAPTPAVTSVPAASTTAPLALSLPARRGSVVARSAVAHQIAALIALETTSVRHFGESNNWVVGPSRSANGQALLANDPHLPQTLPSVWFEVSIHTPHLNLSGVEVPGLPGILLGRNGHVAWGFTNTQNQATLLYRESLNPTNQHYYFWHHAWHAFRDVHYRIAVAGGPAVNYVVPTSVHGPLLALPGGTYAVWWAGAIPNDDIVALTNLWQAGNARQLRSVLRSWKAPNQNMAYIDDHGNFGIVANGLYPQVAHGDMAYPLVGTGADDVIGTLNPADVPSVANPAQGFAVSANQRPVTSAFPFPIGSVQNFYDAGYRANTITARLTHATNVTPAMMASIETDTTDHLALVLRNELLTTVAGRSLTSSQRAAVSLLRHWNGTMQVSSPAAALYWTWMTDYVREVFGPWWRATHVSTVQDHNLALNPATNTALTVDLQTWFAHPAANSAFTLPSGAMRSPGSVLLTALTEATAHLTTTIGPMATWRWGDLLRREFPSLTTAPTWAYGPRPGSGDGFSPDAANGFPIANDGPSWREIIALGPTRSGAAPLTSTGVYPGGQSENPLSPWYETWVNEWWTGTTHPLPTPGVAVAPTIATWRFQP